MIKIEEIKRENLKKILHEKGVTQTALANLMGVQQPHIYALLNGKRNMGRKTLQKICSVLSITEQQLISVSIMPGPERTPRPIPVISWVQAGAFCEAVDMHAAGVSGEGEPVHSTKTAGPHAFALRVEGDSMAPRYLPGDIIVVDPEMKCDNGTPCVVWLNGEVTFKLLWETEKEIRLQPLNDRYPDQIIRKESHVDFRVVGKVVDLIPKM